jgi:TIR domain
MGQVSLARAAHKSRLEVFVSYAREDALLVRDITDELREVFNLLLEFFVDNETIRQGSNWRQVINNHLDSADVLLIISTGQQRESYDFPGYEVGYFSRSIKGRGRPNPDGTGRQIIPLVIGGTTPTAVSDLQGVIIKPDDILSFTVTPDDMSSEEKFLQSLGPDNPFRKMLQHLRDAVTTMSNIRPSEDDLRVLNRKIDECAIRLYKRIFAYLRAKVSTETYPERKLIIRTPLPPARSDDGDILTNSTVEFVGRSFEVFGLPERPRQLDWSTFLLAISRSDIALQWKEGIRALVSDSLSGSPTDNYYFLSSLHPAQSFRLFVSLTRTYYSGQKEVHVYIVELAPTKDYGEAKTTMLLKAIAVGLKYRSLFLENGSPFSPDIVWYSTANFRRKVKDLWDELQRLLTDARQARLDDPQLLSFIYGPQGHETLDKLAVDFHAAEEELNVRTHEVIATGEEKLAAAKPKFMAALENFCEKTEKMNREYTVKALQALESEITRKLVTPAGHAQTPPKTGTA